MGNGPFIDDFRMNTSIYKGFSMAMFNNQMVLIGGFDHLEKYESQWEGLSHILWKIKNV